MRVASIKQASKVKGSGRHEAARHANYGVLTIHRDIARNKYTPRECTWTPKAERRTRSHRHEADAATRTLRQAARAGRIDRSTRDGRRAWVRLVNRKLDCERAASVLGPPPEAMPPKLAAFIERARALVARANAEIEEAKAAMAAQEATP
jgi:hypothetical protein